jgi:hypothetical protein
MRKCRTKLTAHRHQGCGQRIPAAIPSHDAYGSRAYSVSSQFRACCGLRCAIAGSPIVRADTSPAYHRRVGSGAWRVRTFFLVTNVIVPPRAEPSMFEPADLSEPVESTDSRTIDSPSDHAYKKPLLRPLMEEERIGGGFERAYGRRKPLLQSLAVGCVTRSSNCPL